jgi:flagellar biosynthesis/type III secretory pathway protein FliH
MRDTTTDDPTPWLQKRTKSTEEVLASRGGDTVTLDGDISQETLAEEYRAGAVKGAEKGGERGAELGFKHGYRKGREDAGTDTPIDHRPPRGFQ